MSFKGIYMEEASKDEFLTLVKTTMLDTSLVLLTAIESADLMRVNPGTISKMKAEGRLKDYSTRNEHRKFSASEVIALRRNKESR